MSLHVIFRILGQFSDPDSCKRVVGATTATSLTPAYMDICAVALLVTPSLPLLTAFPLNIVHFLWEGRVQI